MNPINLVSAVSWKGFLAELHLGTFQTQDPCSHSPLVQAKAECRLWGCWQMTPACTQLHGTARGALLLPPLPPYNSLGNAHAAMPSQATPFSTTEAAYS